MRGSCGAPGQQYAEVFPVEPAVLGERAHKAMLAKITP